MYILALKNGGMNRATNYFLADDETDLQSIPTETMSMGDQCYIINAQKHYMANSNKEWKEYKGSGGGISPEQMDAKLLPYVYVQEEE